MKKFCILIIALAAVITAQAQWTNDAANNTFVANASNDAGEIYLLTNKNTGDTYFQWNSFDTNGWSPTLQRLDFEGIPQWGDDGIHIGGHQFSSSSEGVAMATTADGGVVSCFAANDDHSYAVKINADGTFAWGEAGIQLFDGLGFSRTELLAGDDGGLWALGSDYNNLYLQYVNADGTLNPTKTISDNTGYKCMFGQLTLSNNNNVFVTYEKLGSGFFTEKQLFVAGYATDGTQISEETLLMATQSFQSTYTHHAISDGMGGGYAYIWHPGIGDAFNTYVFHFNANGASTITSTDGAAVHSADYDNFYLDAYATVDPVSHDLIIAYEQTDASTQSQSRIFVNRINVIGDRLWDDGIEVGKNDGLPYSDIRTDIFEYGEGFSIIYNKTSSQNTYFTTIEAMGLDMNGNILWETQMSSVATRRYMCETTTGFYQGQNIVVWTNAVNGGIYGQNIGYDGTMGEITPPVPPTPCHAPENLHGEYFYNDETQEFGAEISWTAPEELPLHYNLYREGTKEVIEIDGNATSYFDESGIGDFIYRLTAVHEDCESNYALTPEGNNYVLIEVTSVPENNSGTIISVTAIYSINGQKLNTNNINELEDGIYIVQGLTDTGNSVVRKIVK